MAFTQERRGRFRRRLPENGVANPTERRRCHFMTLLPLTMDPVPPSTQRIPVDFRIHIEASAWLAWYHFTLLTSGGNPQNDTIASNVTIVLPELQERFAACNVDFDISMRDTRFSALNAAKELLDAYHQRTSYPEGSFLDQLQDILENETEWNRTPPDVLLGSARSTVSSTVNFISSAYDIPQISSSSTASYLDQKDVYPLFSRTVPTNQGDAQAMAVYFSEYLNASHVGILFINDVYGNSFHSDLVVELERRNIEVHSEPYDDDTTIERTIQQLADSQYHYIVALLNPRTWQSVLRTALQYDIIGRPDYFWMFGESSLNFVDPSFQLRRDTESDLALALHGSAVLAATETPHAPFDQALLEFSQSEALQQWFIESHVDPDIFLNYTFVPPGRAIYQYLTYDAVVAMMLAVCEVPTLEKGNRTKGQAIHEQLLQTEFDGVSGHVAFHPTTGTRMSQGILYGIRNVRFPNATPDAYRVDSPLTALINLTGEASLEFVEPFYYASNTTTPPPPLAPVDVDMNLISTGMRAFCLSLSAMVMCVSVGFGLWTYWHRDKDVVKASQPIFLGQICVGTFIIASAVIPMSMQEPIPDRGLDIACMSAPWLVSVGFVTAFSALFSKTWRLNKLFKYSRNLRRVVVKPRDVALPFFILMTINIGVLLAWTLDAPLVWQRDFVASFDLFDRNLASFGHCEPSDPRPTTIYLSLIVAINISVLLFANYQAYLARTLPTEFSESTYITVAMGLLLEVCILGIPLLFLASGDPTVTLLIRTILATASGLSILLPIFLPKYIQRNVNQRYDKAVLARTGVAPTKSKIVISMGKSNSSSENPGLDPMSDEDTGVVGASKIRRNDDYFKERRISVDGKSGNMRRSTVSTDRGRNTLTSDRTSSSGNPSLLSSNPRSALSESS